MKKETIVYGDLIEILGPRPVPIQPAYEKYVLATTNQISTEHQEVDLSEASASSVTAEEEVKASTAESSTTP